MVLLRERAEGVWRCILSHTLSFCPRVPLLQALIDMDPSLRLHASADDVEADKTSVRDDSTLLPLLSLCAGVRPTLDACRATLRQRFGPQVLALVEAVTDDKSLHRDERKRLQVEHAAHTPHGARLVKLADKIANLRDLAATPPADWTLQRRREYFDWAASVVANLRGTHPVLEALFDAARG